MINILIPLAGKNTLFSGSEYVYPKLLIEFLGKTMIEHVINNFSSIPCEKQFIFIVNSDDCKKYHLHNILNLLCTDKCSIIKIDKETKGAACSALMGVEYINSDIPLIIANADQVFDIDLQKVIMSFEGFDAGVVTFNSIHPRWSYVRKNKVGDIVETSEKRPISKDAVAGFYYFKQGKDFCNSAMTMIKKDACIDGRYFIAPSLNEMILKNKKITSFEIDIESYHSFYAPNKIKEYERLKLKSEN